MQAQNTREFTNRMYDEQVKTVQLLMRLHSIAQSATGVSDVI